MGQCLRRCAHDWKNRPQRQTDYRCPGGAHGVIGRRIKGPGAVDLANVSIPGANLESHADLSGANLSGTDLSGANLLGARGLTQTQLDEACGDANTKLPEGFTPLKPCS